MLSILTLIWTVSHYNTSIPLASNSCDSHRYLKTLFLALTWHTFQNIENAKTNMPPKKCSLKIIFTKSSAKANILQHNKQFRKKLFGSDVVLVVVAYNYREKKTMKTCCSFIDVRKRVNNTLNILLRTTEKVRKSFSIYVIFRFGHILYVQWRHLFCSIWWKSLFKFDKSFKFGL